MTHRRLSIVAFSATLLLSACASSPTSNDSASAPKTDAIEVTGGDVAPVAQTAETYLLAQGDEIAIQVFDEPDLTMEQVVSERGNINYSYLGDIQVAGKTTGELERHLTKLLQDGYLNNPSVNVSVLKYRPFFISGEVRDPGSYPYQPGLTMDKAIAVAGGLTDRASTRQMFVIRAKSDGKQQKISLGDAVNPGDTVTIKEGFF